MHASTAMTRGFFFMGGGGVLGKLLGYMVAFLKGPNLSDVTWDLT
jgi:hypothetical protein